jgi:hypothetical protein
MEIMGMTMKKPPQAKKVETRSTKRPRRFAAAVIARDGQTAR